MTAAALPLATALLLTVAGPTLLRRLGRVSGLAPGGLLAVWTLATVAWLLTWVALVVTLVAQTMGPGLKGVITACVTLLQALHRNGAESAVALTVLGAAVAAVRLAWVGLRRARGSRRWRRDHHRGLTARGRVGAVGGRRVWLVENDRPDVYCVPGRGAGIVVTRGAAEALSAAEMRAVLAHEQAHLRGRHHLLVAWVDLLDSAFPRVPLLRAAAREVPVLVEWAADDQAARSAGVRPLVHAIGAMVATATADRSTAALAASGACTVQRVRRLLRPDTPCTATARCPLVTTAALAALLVPPVLMLVWTTVGVAATQCACTI
ncbi:MAG: M56 family metallopeptidase [Nocardiopsaceae bacterium]|nr:M56 family metallopeptidase [Nocardiopsaceae bacterium]